MNKVKVQMKASFLQLRFCLYIVLGIMAVGIVTSAILDLTMGSDRCFRRQCFYVIPYSYGRRTSAHLF